MSRSSAGYRIDLSGLKVMTALGVPSLEVVMPDAACQAATKTRAVLSCHLPESTHPRPVLDAQPGLRLESFALDLVRATRISARPGGAEASEATNDLTVVLRQLGDRSPTATLEARYPDGACK